MAAGTTGRGGSRFFRPAYTYFQRTPAQQVDTGLQAGKEAGAFIGDLARAYQNMQADKYANQIMNSMPTGQSTTPINLGTLPGGGGGGGGGAADTGILNTP